MALPCMHSPLGALTAETGRERGSADTGLVLGTADTGRLLGVGVPGTGQLGMEGTAKLVHEGQGLSMLARGEPLS